MAPVWVKMPENKKKTGAKKPFSGLKKFFRTNDFLIKRSTFEKMHKKKSGIPTQSLLKNNVLTVDCWRKKLHNYKEKDDTGKLRAKSGGIYEKGLFGITGWPGV